MRHFIELPVLTCEIRVPLSYCKFFYAYVLGCHESPIATQCLQIRVRKAKAQHLTITIVIICHSILAPIFSERSMAAVITQLYSDKSDLISKTAWLALR